MQATFDNCNNFNTKLQDTLKGLINANADRKSEIDSLRNDHEELKKVLSISNLKIQIFRMNYIYLALVLHSPDFLFLYLGSRIISNKCRKRKWSSKEWNQITRGEMPERQPGDIKYHDYFYFTYDCYVLIFYLLFIKGPYHRYRQTRRKAWFWKQCTKVWNCKLR